MTADYNTDAKFKGTKEDITKALDMINATSKETTGYYLKTWEMSDDTKKGDAKTTCTVSFEGPYGRFSLFDEIDIFDTVAEALPKLRFKGNMYGGDGYMNQYMDFKFNGKKVEYEHGIEDNDDVFRAYIDRCVKDVPAKTFKDLFKIKGRFDKKKYTGFFYDVAQESYDGLESFDYSSFQFLLERFGLTSDLDEDAFGEIVSKGFKGLGYIEQDDFEPEPDVRKFYYDLEMKKRIYDDKN